MQKAHKIFLCFKRYFSIYILVARYYVHGLQWCKQHPYARHYLVKYSLQHYLVKYSLNDLCTFNLRPVPACVFYIAVGKACFFLLRSSVKRVLILNTTISEKLLGLILYLAVLLVFCVFLHWYITYVWWPRMIICKFFKIMKNWKNR